MTDKIHYLECKLILDPNGFISREAFFDYGDLVARVASQAGIGWNGLPRLGSPVRIREVTFWDTPDFALHKHNFILRKRTSYQDGFPAADPEIALKYRVPDFELAAGMDMTPILPDEAFHIKFKAEALPSDQGDGIRFVYSHDARTTESWLDASGNGMGSLSSLISTFPVLAAIKREGPIKLVHQTIAEEVLQDLGTLDFGKGGIAHASICLWRERGTHRPLCAEFSFEIKHQHLRELQEKPMQHCHDFFVRLQRNSNILRGVTKTELVYKGV